MRAVAAAPALSPLPPIARGYVDYAISPPPSSPLSPVSNIPPGINLERRSESTAGASAILCGRNVGTLKAESHQLLHSRSVAGIRVAPLEEGVSGTYLLQSATKRRLEVACPVWTTHAVFKPGDEEPGACNNPKGYTCADDGEKGGIKPGDGWCREILAYELDHENFAKVPETVEEMLPGSMFAGCQLPGCKHGSLQRYVQSSGGDPCKAACDVTPGRFPAEEVHRIGQLDLRLLNCDRHGGNILVQRDAQEQIHLIPIDHSYILPKHLKDLDFEWLFWPQSNVPFSAETLSYIAALDAEQDAHVLRRYGIEEECIELMLASTAALKIGCQSGLTLRTIGRFMRWDGAEPSGFEDVLNQARRAPEDGGNIDFDRLGRLLTVQLGSLYVSPVPRSVPDQPGSLYVSPVPRSVPERVSTVTPWVAHLLCELLATLRKEGPPTRLVAAQTTSLIDSEQLSSLQLIVKGTGLGHC